VTPADSERARTGELQRLGALVRLHVVLAYRQASGSSRGERAAASVVLVLALVWTALLAFGLGRITFRVGQDLGPHTSAMQGVFVGFGLAFALLFTICGMFEKGMGGGIDLSRLFHLPVPSWAMVGSGLTARFAAPHMALPAGFVVGYPVVALTTGHPWYALAFVPAALLWFVHLNLILTVVSLLTIRVRASRRLVEGGALLGIILFFAYIAVAATPAQARLDHAVTAAIGLVKGYWDAVYPILLVLPGVSPLTWVHDGGRGALLLLLALVEAVAMFLFARRTVDRLAVTGATAGSAARRSHHATQPIHASLLERMVRWPLLAKDLRMMVRDPTTRLESVVFFTLPLTFGLLLAGRDSAHGEQLLHHLFPLLVVFMLKDRITNHLCREADGLLVILGSTLPRWRILVEKNLSTLVVVLLLMTVPAGLLVWHGATAVSILLDYVFAVSFALLFFGAGNLLAILVPIPMAVKKGQLTTSVPLARVLLSELVQLCVLGLMSCVALPLFAVHLVFVEVAQPAGSTVLAMTGMLVYGLGTYVLLLRGAAALFGVSEPELYEKVIRARG